MKTEISFKSLVALRAAYRVDLTVRERRERTYTNQNEYCTDFDTGARRVVLDKITYAESGWLECAKWFNGSPDNRSRVAQQFGVEIELVKDLNHKLALPDGTPVTKVSIESAVLWYDKEHNRVVSGDSSVYYMNETSHPVGDRAVKVTVFPRKASKESCEKLADYIKQIAGKAVLTDTVTQLSRYGHACKSKENLKWVNDPTDPVPEDMLREVEVVAGEVISNHLTFEMAAKKLLRNFGGVRMEVPYLITVKKEAT